MVAVITQFEPNFIEGRMLGVAYYAETGSLDEAEEGIQHILKLDPGNAPVLIKKKELELLKQGKEIKISLPPMFHKTYLPRDYYTKLHDYSTIKREGTSTQSSGGHITQSSSQPTGTHISSNNVTGYSNTQIVKFCSKCGKKRIDQTHKFCRSCGNKF